MDDRASVNKSDRRHFYLVVSKKSVNLGPGLVVNINSVPESTTNIDLNSDGNKDTFKSCSHQKV